MFHTAVSTTKVTLSLHRPCLRLFPDLLTPLSRGLWNRVLASQGWAGSTIEMQGDNDTTSIYSLCFFYLFPNVTYGLTLTTLQDPCQRVLCQHGVGILRKEQDFYHQGFPLDTVSFLHLWSISNKFSLWVKGCHLCRKKFKWQNIILWSRIARKKTSLHTKSSGYFTPKCLKQVSDFRMIYPFFFGNTTTVPNSPTFLW